MIPIIFIHYRGNTTAVTTVDDAGFPGNFSVYQNTKTTPLASKLNGFFMIMNFIL